MKQRGDTMKDFIGDYGQSKIRYTNGDICMCGKICLTQREAGEQLNRLKGHRTSSHIGRGNDKPKRSYYCRDCGFYHVTHYGFQKKKGPMKEIYGK